MSADYPLRVRLHGGRAAHMAKEIDHGHVTACALFLSRGADNDWLPDDAEVTCRRCPHKAVRTGGAS
jgi:hypothetical protein